MKQDAQRLRPIFTIGYERATLAQVTTALTVAGVELLIDVRAVAALTPGRLLQDGPGHKLEGRRRRLPSPA